MSDLFIAENCSPTLAGIKTGSLFSVAYRDRSLINKEIRDLNHILTEKGLRAVPVRYTSDHVLVYLYCPSSLSRDFNKAEIWKILKEKGYTCANADRSVVELAHKLQENAEFPHEIGVFLGYPAADVRGFMKNTRLGVKLVGYWKVYDNKNEAKRIFSRYRKCTREYCRLVQCGKRLDDLIVPSV